MRVGMRELMRMLRCNATISELMGCKGVPR